MGCVRRWSAVRLHRPRAQELVGAAQSRAELGGREQTVGLSELLADVRGATRRGTNGAGVRDLSHWQASLGRP